MKPREVVWFSCGAASAIAAKLSLARNPDAIVVYCHVREEHEDNMRFLADCERWLGTSVAVLRNEKYDGSIFNVMRSRRYLVGPSGAACTSELKKKLRKEFQRDGDVQVFGYTAEEQDRADRFIDSNPDVRLSVPLIDAGLGKSDCLALVARAGIELPAMYRLGYSNANCVGCVKGGAGYWNKIRRDFPVRFAEMSALESELGRTVLRRDGEPLALADLDPCAGNAAADMPIACGIACEYQEIKDAMRQRRGE